MTSPDSLRKALLCSRAALDKKALDLVILDVGELTTIAHSMIICSGRSDRQVQSIAQAVEAALAASGGRALSVEGATRGQWILIDGGDVIVHVFYEPVRAFYDLERLWQHAPRVPVPDAPMQRATL